MTKRSTEKRVTSIRVAPETDRQIEELKERCGEGTAAVIARAVQHLYTLTFQDRPATESDD